MATMKLDPPKRCELRAEWEAKLERVDERRAEVTMCWSGVKDPRGDNKETERKHSAPFSISVEDLRAWCVEVLRLTGGVP